MKTLLTLICILLASCGETLPIVSNRNPDGTWFLPNCPKDGKAPTHGASVYVCPDKHVFASAFYPITSAP